MSWLLRGLRRGIVTTHYPAAPAGMPHMYRGAVDALEASRGEQQRGAAVCPTQAIEAGDDRAIVDRRRCIQCGLCAAAAPGAFAMSNAFALGSVAENQRTGKMRAFSRSLFIRHIDTGSDGSEEQELQALFNPYYDANRLGIFLTATPRHADVLVVTGPVTEKMREPLMRAYGAMPEPKIVMALGTTACSGGICDPRAIAGPVDRLLPVDAYVPGSPPSPLTILSALSALARGRNA